jgi:hypothetical protein
LEFFLPKWHSAFLKDYTSYCSLNNYVIGIFFVPNNYLFTTETSF